LLKKYSSQPITGQNYKVELHANKVELLAVSNDTFDRQKVIFVPEDLE